MKNVQAILLAAGKGTRMKSDLPKVLHQLAGKSLVAHVISNLKPTGVAQPILIIGHQAQLVKDHLAQAFPEPMSYAIQEKQLGTGHAVLAAKDHIKDFSGPVFILSGDVPLLSTKSLQEMLDFHLAEKNDLTVMSMVPEHAHHYGRIVRDSKNGLKAIVEFKDASEDIRSLKEVNSGSYIVNQPQLMQFLAQVTNDNRAGEYYLTDIIKLMVDADKKTGVFQIKNDWECSGVNTIEELKELEKLYLSKQVKQ